MNRGRFADVRKLLLQMRKARLLGDDYHLIHLKLIRREGRWNEARAAIHDALEEAADSAVPLLLGILILAFVLPNLTSF